MSSSARNLPGARKPRSGVKKTPSFMNDDSSLPANYLVKITPATSTPKGLRQIRRVYVNEGVMKGLKLVVGDIVVIRHEIAEAAEDQEAIGTAFGIAWPTSSLDMNMIQLHAMLGQSHLIYEGDRVRLSTYTGATKTAKELSICCIDEKKPPSSDDPRWISAIKDLLQEIKYITEGMDFECSYDGRTHAFTVVSVIGLDGYRDSMLSGESNEELRKSLNALSVSSEPLLPRYKAFQAKNGGKVDLFGEEAEDPEATPDLFVFEASSSIVIDHRPQSSGVANPGRDSPRMSHRFESTTASASPSARSSTAVKNDTKSPANTNGTRNAARSRLSGLSTPSKKLNNDVNQDGKRTPRASSTPRIMEIDTDEESEIVKESQLPRVSYESIGGLAVQITSLREVVELPLLKPHIFARFHQKPPRGVLLYGPPGTGKTMLLRAVASETSARVFTISGPSIISKYMGEAEEKLRKLWQSAEKAGPSIIFIDEVDAIAPKREADSGEAESRIVAALLTLMDGMDAESRVVVVGATNRPNVIDPALRRPGRFDREIEVGVPDAKARLHILNIMLEDVPHNLSSDFIEEIAAKTHGFVGADLSAVCRESVFVMIRKGRDADIADADLIVQSEHVTEAMHHIRPSAMREVFLELPDTKWTDIGGQEDVKQKLKESVEWPLKHPETFKRLGIVPAKGVLLYGPPGCSKTLTAKALATEAGLNFFAVKGPEIYNKYVGEAERALRAIFTKARENSPSIVFFDEIDALSGSRSGDGEGSSDRILTTLLNEIDGVEELLNVTILAATNRPDVIDSALLRPGRLDRLLYVGPPDSSSRLKILEIQFSRMSIAADVSIDNLARDTDGCSGAEIAALCRDAGLLAMREAPSSVERIEDRHFQAALRRLKRGITPQMVEFYESFAATYGDSV